MMKPAISYPRQILISQPLWGFVDYCQIYCTAACCGTDAFELHPALLLRRVIDLNVENSPDAKGTTAFTEAFRQTQELVQGISSQELIAIGEDVPVWRSFDEDLPEFWLPKHVVIEWFKKWESTFQVAAATSFGAMGHQV